MTQGLQMGPRGIGSETSKTREARSPADPLLASSLWLQHGFCL